MGGERDRGYCHYPEVYDVKDRTIWRDAEREGGYIRKQKGKMRESSQSANGQARRERNNNKLGRMQSNTVKEEGNKMEERSG